MTQIKEGAQRQGLMLDSHDELYKWFTLQVRWCSFPVAENVTEKKRKEKRKERKRKRASVG